MTTLQKQLILCYYGCLDPLGIDGKWGENEVFATKKLQSLLGLNPDGIWGAETDEAVNEIFL